MKGIDSFEKQMDSDGIHKNIWEHIQDQAKKEKEAGQTKPNNVQMQDWERMEQNRLYAGGYKTDSGKVPHGNHFDSPYDHFGLF